MRIKEKFIKEKQLTDRQMTRNTDSSPLLARLEKQYLINHPIKTDRDNSSNRQNKQNHFSMINTVPSNREYQSHNVIKIDNYQGKRFKTQQGYQPMMIKSRYMQENQNNSPNNNIDEPQNSVYTSNECVVLRREKCRKKQDKICGSVDFGDMGRPLTFGLVRKGAEPMRTSKEYKEDVQIKNQVLDQLSTLRKSQETLYGSKDYSATGFENVVRCSNHHNKKAKYRLMGEMKEDEAMVYCSKCAINLLQQGFKVQQIKPALKMTRSQHHLLTNHMLQSTGAPSRIQDMKNFQHKLSQLHTKITTHIISQSPSKNSQLCQYQSQIHQTSQIYNSLIMHLQKQKQQQLQKLRDKKQKKIYAISRYQKQLNHELESLEEMKKEMREFRNKFIIMRETEFQFLISSFLNKIQLYGQNMEKSNYTPLNLQDQLDRIIIELCQFCKLIKQGTQVPGQLEEDQQSYRQGGEWEGPREQKGEQDQEETDTRVFCSYEENQNECPYSEDEFICKEIKGPFRTLFPEQDSQCQQQVQDSPTFNRNLTKQTANQQRPKQMITEYF